jgi:thioredoxin 1
MAGSIELTEAGFDAAIEERAGLTLVDFWAPWCAPCRAVAPMLEELAAQYAERLTVAKVNVDDNPGAAARFGIQSIPTLLLFQDGELVQRIVGAPPKRQLQSQIEAHLDGEARPS